MKIKDITPPHPVRVYRIDGIRQNEIDLIIESLNVAAIRYDQVHQEEKAEHAQTLAANLDHMLNEAE